MIPPAYRNAIAGGTAYRTQADSRASEPYAQRAYGEKYGDGEP